uniref:Uncharacterized protein n=1 Tax=Ascaris lumbricoides TaxID=6252 RepID=A0A0M3I4J0_ASCLU
MKIRGSYCCNVVVSLVLLIIAYMAFADNAWQCICGEEWLADWLATVADKNVADGSMGCIGSRACTGRFDEEEQHSVWITVIASLLAVVSLLILVAIAFLYLEDGKRVDKIACPLRRVPSDLLQLIPSGGSSISLPHDNGIEPLITAELPPKPLLTSSLRNTTATNTSATNTNPLIIANTNEIPTVGTAEKKRVRFNGISAVDDSEARLLQKFICMVKPVQTSWLPHPLCGRRFVTGINSVNFAKEFTEESESGVVHHCT